MSQDSVTALQPGRQSETSSLQQQQNRLENNNILDLFTDINSRKKIQLFLLTGLIILIKVTSFKNVFQAWQGGSCLYCQHFGRPRWVDHLRLGVQDQPGQHGESLSLLKIQKLSWCGIHLLLATREAEAGESLEPGRQRWQWSEITPLHSSLENRGRPHLQEKGGGVEA